MYMHNILYGQNDLYLYLELCQLVDFTYYCIVYHDIACKRLTTAVQSSVAKITLETSIVASHDFVVLPLLHAKFLTRGKTSK